MLIPGYRYSLTPGGLKRTKIYKKASDTHRPERFRDNRLTMPVEHCRQPQRMRHQTSPTYDDHRQSCYRCDPTTGFDHPIDEHGTYNHLHKGSDPSRDCLRCENPSDSSDRCHPLYIPRAQSRRKPKDIFIDNCNRPTRRKQTRWFDGREFDEESEEEIAHSCPGLPLHTQRGMERNYYDSEDSLTPRRRGHGYQNNHPPCSSNKCVPRRERHNLSSDQRPMHKEAECHGVDFEAAVEKLKQITDQALEFFGAFQEDFQNEVHQLTAYANRNTIKSIWMDKILRNEKYSSVPKDGWKTNTRHHSKRKRNNEDKTQEQDWSNGNNEGSSNDIAASAETRKGHHQQGHSITFGEHQAELKKNIMRLLNCQIRRPKVSSGYDGGNFSGCYGCGQDLNGDDYTGPGDIQDMAKYNNAHRLRERVDHCKDDLLPLLDRIRKDSRSMEAALIELDHLANVLETYGQSWRRAAPRRNDDYVSIE